MSKGIPTRKGSEDPFLAEADIPVLEPLVKPILTQYRELQRYIFVVAYISAAFNFCHECLFTGFSEFMALLSKSLGTVIIVAMHIGDRHVGASAHSIRCRDMVFASAAIAFDGVCCAGFWQQSDPVLEMTVTFAVPVVVTTQVLNSRITFIFLSCHVLCLSLSSVLKSEATVATVVVALCLAAHAHTKHRVLQLAQEAEDRNHHNYTELRKQVEALHHDRMQWRDLLDRAFDGIVLLEGLEHIRWANAQFWTQFHDLKPGCSLRSAFAKRDWARFDAVCNAEPKDATKSSVRTMLTCDSGASGWEFDCELVVVNALDKEAAGGQLLGVRIVGEARPLDDQERSWSASSSSSTASHPPLTIETIGRTPHGNIWEPPAAAAQLRGRRNLKEPSLPTISETETGSSRHDEWQEYFGEFLVLRLLPRVPTGNRHPTLKTACANLKGFACQQCGAGVHPSESSCFICEYEHDDDDASEEIGSETDE
eukprot:gnl/TRDRNA2_/TRDRNA2_171414_c0_seq6.p1 gnl/TRDRNA2_/TRDRNA2_171414_c0~~gnl/TRDRNA2_/TRDRNA2_171414_c0_seq6.p1  ORF type:complete len:481 (-),score=69.32 gnl/TRDRNA2_/TRDRNA2_171414_c0_seq6:224-1666(-)